MYREPGGNDSLHSAKHPDPSNSGIRNRHSPQRCVLVGSNMDPSYHRAEEEGKLSFAQPYHAARPLRIGPIPEFVVLIGGLLLAMGALAFDAPRWKLRSQGNKHVKEGIAYLRIGELLIAVLAGQTQARHPFLRSSKPSACHFMIAAILRRSVSSCAERTLPKTWLNDRRAASCIS
jgi:hypothetical protein